MGALRLFDSVFLTEDHGGHPAGTFGAVVEVYPDSTVEVELIDHRMSYTLDVLAVPLEKLQHGSPPPTSRFVVESADEFVRPGEHKTEPFNVQALLNRLRVTRASISEQRSAVADWLTRNEASTGLEAALRERRLVD